MVPTFYFYVLSDRHLLTFLGHTKDQIIAFFHLTDYLLRGGNIHRLIDCAPHNGILASTGFKFYLIADFFSAQKALK